MPRRQTGLGENTDNDNVNEKNVYGDNMRIRRPLYHNMMMMCVGMRDTDVKTSEIWSLCIFVTTFPMMIMMMWIMKMRIINDHLAKHQEEERQRQEREGGVLEKRRQTVS